MGRMSLVLEETTNVSQMEIHFLPTVHIVLCSVKRGNSTDRYVGCNNKVELHTHI